MRHRYVGRKLGRGRPHREAMRRQTVSALFLHERIITTVERAKEFRIFADRIITIGKNYQAAKDGAKKIHFLRQAHRHLQNEAMAKKVCTEIAVRFLERPGGYTRVLKLGGSRWSDNAKYAATRLGDGGERAILELVVKAGKPEDVPAPAVKAAKKTKSEATVKEKKGKEAAAGT
ncbi:MAG: large subunit ribosomal protein [Planctomycetota bacterium]|nr:MAG: large subunit ribosomal protein [Planctomycetota bacterium]